MWVFSVVAAPELDAKVPSQTESQNRLHAGTRVAVIPGTDRGDGSVSRIGGKKVVQSDRTCRGQRQRRHAVYRLRQRSQGFGV